MGLFWAFLTPIFLGTIPIIAKVAYSFGVDVFTVAAFRTILAALLLWTFILIFSRHYIASSIPGVVGSLIAGSINGIGSLFFYTSLSRIDASVGQLVNITYLIFVTFLLRLIGQRISRLTLARIGLAIFSIYLLTSGGLGQPDWIGVGYMLIGAFAYAVQLVLSQRIMYDIPAPTMALYAMTGMATVVAAAWLIARPPIYAIPSSGWIALILMGLTTALSRLTLFLGVKNLGSIQTALISVTEVIVSIFLATVFLREMLTETQWIGALILIFSILLVKYESNIPKFDLWVFIYRKWSHVKYRGESTPL